VATIKHFRCLRTTCQKLDMGRFFSAAPRCPQCGLEGNDPDGKNIVLLVMVHYDPPRAANDDVFIDMSGKIMGTGKGHRACEPRRSIQAAEDANGVPVPWHAGTGIKAQVTCPACKQTEEFKTSKG
jgi:hypothetical protein